MQLMSYEVYDDHLHHIKLSGKRCIINTINPHSYCVAKKDNVFWQALLQSDVLLPDGSGILWAAAILRHKRIRKIAGADMHEHLLKQLQTKAGKCFYLGASSDTLARIKCRLEEEFPSIQADFYSPPFKAEFSAKENEHMIQIINAFSPEVLFVGMTAPKQEKWVFRHASALQVPVLCSIGAVFDFYAGTKKRSGAFWQKMGLEWLPRFIREPRRMWNRIFVSIPVFMWDILRYKLGWLK